jgi:hypothetical protein
MKLLSLCLCLLLAAASADNWAAVGKEKRVLIEGWNAYLHSYSIVNAFHMAHLYPYTLNQSTAQSGAGIKGRASVCDRVPGDGLGDLVETDVKSRPCRLRLHFLELPPYLSRWRPHDRSFMFDNSSHIENVEKIPHLRIPIPQNSLSQHWVPPPEALYDLIKTHVDERGVEHYELHWRFDAVFRIGAPLNIHLPQVPPNTDKKVITTVVRDVFVLPTHIFFNSFISLTDCFCRDPRLEFSTLSHLKTVVSTTRTLREVISTTGISVVRAVL